MKTGDLVHDRSCDRYGIILTWLTMGGPSSTFWEILYEDGRIDGAFEDELEVVSER